jgi:protocatechuate 3,4-dioxygenase beta subunit
MWMMVVSAVLGAAEAKTLKGTVTGPDGAPVDGAAVSVYAVQFRGEWLALEIQPVGQTTTCSSGLFSVQTDVQIAPNEGGWLFFAEKPGLSIGFSFLENALEDTTSLQLTTPQTLAGRIEDIHGNPVVGAEVRLLILSVPGERECYTLALEPIPFFVALTDTQGRFEFANLPENCTAELMVKKAGLATFHTLTPNINPQTGLTFAVGQEDIVLTLSEACRISGRVSDQDNQPAGHVQIVAIEADHPEFRIFTRNITRAEADGTFSFSDLAAGSYRLSVVDTDWMSEPVTVDVKTEVGVPLKVVKGSLLTVTVVDGVSNQPVGSAQVNVSPLDERSSLMSRTGTTDPEGKVQCRVLPGTYNVSVYAPGYRSRRSVAAVVEDGKVNEITITLIATARIAGTVTDSDGRPVAGAHVFVLPDSSNARDAIQTTDENGHFTLGWAPEQISWAQGEFYLAAIDKSSNRAVIEPIDADTTDIQLTLQPGLTITGKVIGPDGGPLAGAGVIVQFRGSNWSSTLQGYTPTDQDGMYRFTAIPPQQRYYLSIFGPTGYGTGSVNLEFPTDGDRVTVPDTMLKLANLSVSGKVVDEDGNPLEGVNLFGYGPGQPRAQARTGTDGTFVFDAVCQGDLAIQASYQKDGEYMYSDVRTEGGAQDVTIVLSPQRSGGRFVPRQPAPLVGKLLPDLSGYGVELQGQAGPVLVCVWDWRQRPSRAMVRQLAERADALAERSIQVVLLNGEPTEPQPMKAWLADFDIPFACGIIADEAEKIRFELGVQAMPWLILADGRHTVIAEGCALLDVFNKVDSVQ